MAKKISLEGLKFEEVDRTMREIEIHKQLRHPNIIAFREYFLEEDILIIVMEYCECTCPSTQSATSPCTSRAASRSRSTSRRHWS